MTTLERLQYNLIRSILEDTDESRFLEIYALYFDDKPLRYSDDEINEFTQQFENRNGITNDSAVKHP